MIATSIEQSKNLLKLGLKAATADMHYYVYPKEGNRAGLYIGYDSYETLDYIKRDIYDYIPAWSLSALEDLTKVCQRYERLLRVDKRWNVFAVCEDDVFRGFDVNPKGYETPFDATYALIVWLLENKHL